VFPQHNSSVGLTFACFSQALSKQSAPSPSLAQVQGRVKASVAKFSDSIVANSTKPPNTSGGGLEGDITPRGSVSTLKTQFESTIATSATSSAQPAAATTATRHALRVRSMVRQIPDFKSLHRLTCSFTSLQSNLPLRTSASCTISNQCPHPRLEVRI